jgi:hypothetical protein
MFDYGLKIYDENLNEIENFFNFNHGKAMFPNDIIFSNGFYWIADNESGIIKFNSWKSVGTFARQILKANENTDYYVIMNPSQFLTPVVRILTNKKLY